MLYKTYKTCKILDYILDKIITLIIIILLLLGFMGLYNTFNVVSNASLSDNIQRFKPSGESINKGSPNVKGLIDLYPDVRAWIRIIDTNIDYPVVQGKDNSEYLNKTVEGDYSLSGSIFLDSRNDPNFKSLYSLLYGHHMIGDMMFGSLQKYKEKEYFNSHLKGYLYLKDKTYVIDIFAGMETKAYDKKIFYPLWVINEKEKSNMISYIKENSVNFVDIDFTENNKIIALSTCDNVSTDGRFIVFGRLSEYIP